jgi:hypothetical protein
VIDILPHIIPPYPFAPHQPRLGGTARARIDGETVKPSAFAVLRLMASSTAEPQVGPAFRR